MEQDIQTIAINFIRTLENRNSAEKILTFYHPDIEQIEIPNTLIKFTVIRNLNDLKGVSERGKEIMSVLSH